MAYVGARMKALGRERVLKAQAVAREGVADQISRALLIAVSLRESGGRNVLGDQGHARGAFQITDWYHREFLRSVRGCVAAKLIPEATRLNWIPVPGANAAMRGMAPTWEDGARYVVKLLNEYIVQAKAAKVPAGRDRLAVAVAAFNAGMSAALEGHRAGDPDVKTTGANYSADVLLRRSEVSEWLAAHPNWKA